MQHNTIGKQYGPGRIVQVACLENPTAEDLNIRDECFLLLLITHGTAVFSAYDREFTAVAPCLVCFDETDDPHLLRSRDLQCWGVFFHPTFLNVNLTFSRLRAAGFEEVAAQHDFFLLSPFLRHGAPLLLPDGSRMAMENACWELRRELTEQPDWYWSCRARSYVMEMLITLEHLYAYEGQPEGQDAAREAILYLETHYSEEISLERLSDYCRVNRTTLTRCVREVTGLTPREYLLSHRLRVAKKHLAFTDVPIKEIARRCGFKTVQHFGRIFREQEGITPAAYRVRAVQRRREGLQKEERRM